MAFVSDLVKVAVTGLALGVATGFGIRIGIAGAVGAIRKSPPHWNLDESLGTVVVEETTVNKPTE